MRLAAALALVVVAACSPAPAPREPPANHATAAPVDAGATIDAADCVATCVAHRQMQATSIEQIEASCRRDCADPRFLP
jgi:hypothetical protein